MTKKNKAKVAIRNAYEAMRKAREMAGLYTDGPYGQIVYAMKQLDIAEEHLRLCERTCCNHFCDDSVDEETEE